MQLIATGYRPDPTQRSPWLRRVDFRDAFAWFYGPLIVLLVVSVYLHLTAVALAVIAIGHGFVPLVGILYAKCSERHAQRVARRMRAQQLMRASQERFGLAKA